MAIIKHQFQSKDFYIPNWRVKYLFIGTFNPEGGETVSYYYGRKRNKAWELLSKLFEIQFSSNAEEFLSQIKAKAIACVDLIGEIEAPEEKLNKIFGQGYKDAVIINKTVKRKYNTELIHDVISKNESVIAYSTWGKGSNLKEWKKEVSKIGDIVSLVSPSMAAKVPKGNKKFEYMLSDWKSKINIVS